MDIEYHRTVLESLYHKGKNSKKMWISAKNRPRYYELKAAIMSCKHKGRMSVAKYFAKLKRLWDDIDNYERISVCD